MLFSCRKMNFVQGTSEGQRKSANALGAKISFGKVHIFGNRGRSTGGLGTQNISLPHEKASLIALVGTTEGALVRWNKKIDFPLGNYILYFLETEEGLLVA